jgi:hypothetical protein
MKFSKSYFKREVAVILLVNGFLFICGLITAIVYSLWKQFNG